MQGQFDDPEGFERLAAVLDELDGKGARGNRMFYLATPPSQFEVLVKQLGEAGLARRGAFDGEHAAGRRRPAGLDAGRHREAVRPRPRRRRASSTA